MSLSDVVLFVMPFFSVWCFYAGFKLGKTERMPVVKVETPKQRREARQRSKEGQEAIDRLNKLQRNLENYRGNGEGQIKL